MLKLNKKEVHFLVTAEMKKEVADFLEAVDAKIAPVLEYIKENQVERVCFIGCGSSVSYTHLTLPTTPYV